MMMQEVSTMGRTRRSDPSPAINCWRNCVQDSTADRMRLSANVHAANNEGEFKALVRLSLVGSNGFARSWDVLRSPTQFRELEHRLCKSGFYCPELVYQDNFGTAQAIGSLARWLNSVLTIWQRRPIHMPDHHTFLVKEFDYSRQDMSADDIEWFLFDNEPTQGSFRALIFDAASVPFAQARGMVEEARRVSPNRRSSVLLDEIQRVHRLEEDIEIQDLENTNDFTGLDNQAETLWSGATSKASTTLSKSYSTSSSRALDAFTPAFDEPFNTAPTPLLPVLLLPKLVVSEASTTVSATTATPVHVNVDVDDNVNSNASALRRRVRRCASFGVYPSGRPVSKRSLKHIKVDMLPTKPPSRSERHRRNISESSMFSAGSDLFHFHFSRHKSTTRVAEDIDITALEYGYDDDDEEDEEDEFDFDEDDDYFGELSYLDEDDDLFSVDGAGFRSDHGFVEAASSYGTLSCNTTADYAYPSIAQPGENVAWDTDVGHTVAFEVGDRALTRVHSDEDAEEDEMPMARLFNATVYYGNDGTEPYMCWSPVSIPDTEQAAQQFCQQSHQRTNELLQGVRLKLIKLVQAGKVE